MTEEGGAQFEQHGLSVVIPAYNEADGLERTVSAVVEAADELQRLGEICGVEIIVVNDASTDGTGELLDALAAADPRVIAVHHPRNRQLGGAIRSGFDVSRGAWVLYTDADLPFDLFELEKAYRLIRHYDADIISAYRHDRTGEGPRRLIYSYLYNSLIHVSLGLRVRDVNFAGKLLSRAVLDTIDLESEGSFIDVEILGKAHAAGFHIIQFGVDYFPRSRGVSTLSSVSVIRKMLMEMWHLRGEINVS